MILKGNIYILDRLDPMYIPQGKVLYIGDPEPQINQMIQSVNGVMGSILMPPYEALMAKLDMNNIQQFNAVYFSHLNSREAIDLISGIIRALYEGINILIYSKSDEYELYLDSFMYYMFTSFGITIGTPNNPCGYDGMHDVQILTMLYETNLLSYQDLIVQYPQAAPFADSTIYKMMIEHNFTGNVVDYRQYFYNFKESIKQNNNVYLNNPFRKVNM